MKNIYKKAWWYHKVFNSDLKQDADEADRPFHQQGSILFRFQIFFFLFFLLVESHKSISKSTSWVFYQRTCDCGCAVMIIHFDIERTLHGCLIQFGITHPSPTSEGEYYKKACSNHDMFTLFLGISLCTHTIIMNKLHLI